MQNPVHHRRPVIAAVAALLVLVAVAAPAGAASPEGVTIVSNVTFNPDGPNFGDFVATGEAVDSGTICPSGTFVDTSLLITGFQSDRGRIQVQVVKELTCADGSGTIIVKLQIQANFETGIESFTWVVLGGTGDYDSLRGGGSGSSVPRLGGNINTYQGFLLG